MPGFMAPASPHASAPAHAPFGARPHGSFPWSSAGCAPAPAEALPPAALPAVVAAGLLHPAGDGPGRGALRPGQPADGGKRRLHPHPLRRGGAQQEAGRHPLAAGRLGASAGSDPARQPRHDLGLPGPEPAGRAAGGAGDLPLGPRAGRAAGGAAGGGDARLLPGAGGGGAYCQDRCRAAGDRHRRHGPVSARPICGPAPSRRGRRRGSGCCSAPRRAAEGADRADGADQLAGITLAIVDRGRPPGDGMAAGLAAGLGRAADDRHRGAPWFVAIGIATEGRFFDQARGRRHAVEDRLGRGEALGPARLLPAELRHRRLPRRLDRAVFAARRLARPPEPADAFPAGLGGAVLAGVRGGADQAAALHPAAVPGADAAGRRLGDGSGAPAALALVALGRGGGAGRRCRRTPAIAALAAPWHLERRLAAGRAAWCCR